MQPLTVGRCVLAFLGAFTSIAPYLADFNETHVHNPNWPPHARFHNGQTMSTGLLLGALTVYSVLHTPSPVTSKSTDLALRLHLDLQSLNLALVFIHLYYIPALSGILYPGAKWADPEFGDSKPQVALFPAVLAIAWISWLVERRRLQSAMVLERGAKVM